MQIIVKHLNAHAFPAEKRFKFQAQGKPEDVAPYVAIPHLFPEVARWDFSPRHSIEENLELAFRFTNSVEDAWFKSSHPQLTVLGEARRGTRSTSVGDVMVVQDDKGVTHSIYVVAPCGFQEV